MTNKYYHCTLSCITRNTFSCIREIFVVIYTLLYNEKYIFMYKRNKYCRYTSSYIMITNISCT